MGTLVLSNHSWTKQATVHHYFGVSSCSTKTGIEALPILPLHNNTIYFYDKKTQSQIQEKPSAEISHHSSSNCDRTITESFYLETSMKEWETTLLE
jgi:hypothetical protein